jgi:hypothetical protein
MINENCYKLSMFADDKTLYLTDLKSLEYAVDL